MHLQREAFCPVYIFNGPKSFHNLNESRAFLEENQGGKMSARQGRQGEEGVERENEQQ